MTDRFDHLPEAPVMGILFLLVILPALLLGFLTLLFSLGQVLAPERMTRLSRAVGQPEFNLWQVAAAVAAVLLLVSFESGPHGFDASYGRYRMMWLLFYLVFVPAMVVFALAALFHLGQIGSADGARRFGSGFRTWKFNLWQMMAVVVVAGLLLHAFSARRPEDGVFSVVLLSLGILAWFVRTWSKEFVFLMGLQGRGLPRPERQADLGGRAAGLRAGRRLVLPVVSPGPLARSPSRRWTPSSTRSRRGDAAG